MVGTPDVDDQVVSALQFVEVIGNVAGEIGVLAVLPLHDPILFVSEGCRTEPFRAFLNVKMAALLQLKHGFFNLAAGEQGAFGEPAVEGHTEFRQIVLAIGQLGFQCKTVHLFVVVAEQALGIRDQVIKVAFGINGSINGISDNFTPAPLEATACGAAQLLRHDPYVVAAIGIGGKLDSFTALLNVAQPCRQCQDVHLPAGIVDIVLTRYVESGGLQDGGKAGTVGGAAAMADMQGTGWVGGNKFDLGLLVLPVFAAAVARSRGQHAADDLLFVRLRQKQVDESCAGDFGLGEKW